MSKNVLEFWTYIYRQLAQILIIKQYSHNSKYMLQGKPLERREPNLWHQSWWWLCVSVLYSPRYCSCDSKDFSCFYLLQDLVCVWSHLLVGHWASSGFSKTCNSEKLKAKSERANCKLMLSTDSWKTHQDKILFFFQKGQKEIKFSLFFPLGLFTFVVTSFTEKCNQSCNMFT